MIQLLIGILSAIFFTNLTEVRTRHNYAPQNIHNVDETGLTTVQKQVKIIAVPWPATARGTLVTASWSINAIGNSIPPFFIFPQVNFKQIHGGPPGCAGTSNPSGWMNATTFIEWMKHFIKQTRCSLNEPVLLLLDNHESHISIVWIWLSKME